MNSTLILDYEVTLFSLTIPFIMEGFYTKLIKIIKQLYSMLSECSKFKIRMYSID